jgi:DNA polymerase-3 subunit delta
MTDEKPIVYILHGDDPVEIGKFIDAMTAKVAETGMAELNLTQIDGRSYDESDLKTAALSLPFLADRRLVILDQAQATLHKNGADQWEPFLNSLPETTALVLVARDEFVSGGKNRGWQALDHKHWIWKWIEGAGSRVFYRACRQPGANEMARWIRQKAGAMQGKFTTGAAVALADHTGTDTQYAAQEITKLLTDVDYQRPVELEDVEKLTAPGGQVNVFDMVDGLAEGNVSRAMRLLRSLLDETDPLNLFGMIVRQFRLLIQAREILDEGGSMETLSSELKIPGFIARKLSSQAGGFSLERLSAVYHRLLELDEGTKTGQWPVELAMELFVAELNA